MENSKWVVAKDGNIYFMPEEYYKCNFHLSEMARVFGLDEFGFFTKDPNSLHSTRGKGLFYKI